jgi:hypothetical protein
LCFSNHESKKDKVIVKQTSLFKDGPSGGTPQGPTTATSSAKPKCIISGWPQEQDVIPAEASDTVIILANADFFHE